MMDAMSRSTTRAIDFQPFRAGGVTTELKGLSTGQMLTQALPQRIGRAASTTLATLERSVFQKINQYRQQNGLSSLRLNSTISQQARQHSQTMANSRNLTHDGFDGRVQTIRGSIQIRGAAENVAFNRGFSDPVAQAVDGWIKSPGHLQNIMGNYNLTGVGVAQNNQGEFYFTQVFVRR